MLAVTILGNNSALPAFDRHPTAQVVTLNEHLFLVDCGEGTQIQIAKYRIRRSRIQKIFISHLHGDHYFGLVGLITTMGLLGRENDLHVYGPAELEPIIQLQLKAGGNHLPFKLQFYTLHDGMTITEDKFEITCFKVFHRIECYGFVFREVRAPRRINPDKIKLYSIPTPYYDWLRWGHDFVSESGEVIANELVTEPGSGSKSYAYAADTLFERSIACRVKGVDLLYHETTYLHDLAEKATKRFHSTAVQAATIAKEAGVHRLIIGHFSSKYEKLDPFEEEAREIFPSTDLALEGVTYRV
ncbi:MAG: ribonuclease Z [Williamsia sp.]|nr:ribonuclease Z [Williamsia sp.]